MTQFLLDMGITQNQINLNRAKNREALNANLEARKARQVAQGMTDGFDPRKVEGISLKAKEEKLAKEKEATPATPAPVVEEVKAEEPKVEEVVAEPTPEAPAAEEPK